MNTNKLNFESENLVVDWVGLNCEELEPADRNRIVAFLYDCNFNSSIKKRVNRHWENEKLATNKKHKYHAQFIQYDYEPESKSFWVGTKINFTGKNAEQFYHSSTGTGSSFWSTLNLEKTTLARFDLCFDRPNKENENDKTFQKFLEACQSDLLNETKRASIKLQRNKRGSMLTVGSRQSTKFFRIYQKETGSRFELEIKNKDQYLKSIQNLLFQNLRLDFENKLTNYFYLHSKKIFNLNYSYADWLVPFFQKERYSRNHFSFVTGYLKDNPTFPVLTEDIKKNQQLYRLLQFISFSQTQAGTSIEIGSHKYQVIKFKVQDFMDYLKVKNDGRYQVSQLTKFFYGLTHNQHLVKAFSEHEFQIIATFPFVKVDDHSGFWQAQIYLNHELYSYRYPFSFPESYLNYQDNYDLQVKLQIIQSFAKARLRKQFHAQEFLKRFKNLPNQTKSHIKKLILLNLKALFGQKLIQKDIRLDVLGNKRKKKPRIQKTMEIELNQLTSLLIGKTQILYYFEIL